MDNEVKALAALALRNAFYRDFSALVNKYLEASAGLINDQEGQLSELASVYGRDDEALDDEAVNIRTSRNKGVVKRYFTMLDALMDGRAAEISLQGKQIFERRNGEWYFCE